MRSISVVVSVFNGEKYLAQCLSSVQDIASEIIVVDHESSDKTLEIAKKFTKKVYVQKNNPNDIDRQKNFGFEKASGDWILSLDADEQVSPELAGEISSVLQGTSSVAGYYIPRKNIIFGKWIEHTGWYPDYRLILFKRGKGKFISRHVHENVVVDGTTDKLENPIIHEAYQTIPQFLRRGLLVYAPNEAEAKKSQGYVFSYTDALQFPFQEFLSRFFSRQGYKDGFHGLVLSLLMAFYHFVVFLYLWEQEKFVDDKNSLQFFPTELKKAKKEFRYWVDTKEIEQIQNPAAKVLLRAKRKLHL